MLGRGRNRRRSDKAIHAWADALSRAFSARGDVIAGNSGAGIGAMAVGGL